MEEPEKHYEEKYRERFQDDVCTLIIFGINAVLALGILWYLIAHHAFQA